jgi:phosphate transport system substrate-binding protein
VAADRRGIGFIGLRYVRDAKPVMVKDAGSVPLLPSPMTVSTEDYPLARRLYLYLPLGAPARCTSCGPEYRSALRTQLDTRALRDLQRLVTLMGRPENAARALVLLGFSDGRGARGDNVYLYLAAACLDRRGAAQGARTASRLGAGPRPEHARRRRRHGRRPAARNRRVEVWLR